MNQPISATTVVPSNPPQKHYAHGQTGSGMRFFRPLLKQVGLLLVGFGDDGTNLIHGVFTQIGHDDLGRGVEPLASAQIDRFLELRQLGVDQE